MRLLLSFVILLMSTAAFGQSRSGIYGYVRDARTGETLIMANVIVAGTTTGAATNTSGYYTLTGLPAGSFTFVASYLGYESARVEMTLGPGENRRVDFRLSPDGVSMEEVVVQADRDGEELRTAVGVAQMPVRLVQQLPAVFEADVFRSLQLLPGIAAASDFSSGLYIRGGSPDQTMILLDGTTVYNPTHVFGFFSTFNPDALKDIQVFKGGFPARYGGRLGSVVDVYNKDGNRERFAGSATVGLLASRIAAEGPYARGSWMLTARRSTVEPLLAVLRESEEGIPDLFFFYDLNGKLNFDAGANDRFSFAFYGGTDRLDIEPSDDLEIKLRYGNRTGSLNWTHIFSNDLFANATITGSRYFSEPLFSIGGTPFVRSNTVEDVSLRADLEYVPGLVHSVEGGLWAGSMVIRLYDEFDGEESFSSRLSSDYIASYLQHTWRPSYRWMLRYGLRSTYHSGGNHFRLEPRLQLEHRRSERLRYQAAYGRYYQFLSLITNEAFSGLDVWLLTGDGVRPSGGDQFVLGFKSVPVENWRFDMEWYYRTMFDLFELDPNLRDVSGFDYADVFQFGDGYAYGGEFMVERVRGRLTGFLGYTYGNTKRRFPGINDGLFFPPKFDRTHDLNLVTNYDWRRNWRMTAVFSYGTGQAYTRPLGRSQYDLPFVWGATDDFVVGRVNASRLPPYHRLDVGVTRLGRLFGGNYELQAQVINIYNRRNTWFYTYDFRENPASINIVRMLPILPNFSFTVRF
jgi:hypothetical protein